MNTAATVLVVGAGPTGLTAAMELTRLGIPVRLVDKLPAAGTTSRALAVQARTLELFERRGLADKMLALGNPARAAALHSGKELLGKESFSHISSPYKFILMLSQAETERLLTEKLAALGVQVERSCEMVAFSQQGSSQKPGSVRAVLRHADGTLEQVETAYMIAAEGAHSSVRQTMDLHFEGETLSQKFLLGDVHIDGDIPEDEVSLFVPENGFLALFPMRDRRFRMIATESLDSPRVADPTLEELQAAFSRDSYIPARLHDLVWSSHFAVNSRMLKHLRQGRVFFGGDSAHVHSPAGGQGMNTGIQDMIDLAWKLAMVLHGTASPTLLDTYESDRIPVIRGVLKTTEAMTAGIMTGKSITHDTILRVIPFALRLNLVQSEGTGVLSQTKLGYRESTLSANHKAPGHVHAGDRIPFQLVSLRTNSAQAAAAEDVQLQTLVDPSRLTLFADGASTHSGLLADLKTVLKPWGDNVAVFQLSPPSDTAEAKSYREHFGSSGFLLLARPDSYAGFLGGPGSLPQMSDWLQRWFPVTPSAPAHAANE